MQKYLIDTQILIWSLISPEKLSSQIAALLSFNLVYVSQISLLEITIKQKLGKLPELQLSTCDLETIIANDGFTLIALEVGHISEYNSIPLFGHHKDPFDRLLLATALAENVPLISADNNFKIYQNLVEIIEA